VVTTLEAAPSSEARFLLGELGRRGLPLGAVVANRVLPTSLRALDAREAATRLVDIAGPLADGLAPVLGTDQLIVERVLAEVGTRFHDFGVVAARQAEREAELRDLCPLVVSIPWFDSEVDDLSTLARVGMSAWGRG